MVVFNAVLAFTAVAGLIFTGLQLKVAQGQLEQAQLANEKVNDALKAANRQAEAAETANKLNMEALSASDRPWVSVSVTSAIPMSPSSDYNVLLDIKNSGKTPAIDVKALYKIDIISKNDTFPVYDLGNDVFKHAIFPDTKYQSVLTLSKENISKSMADFISVDKAVIVTYAIEYKDVNRKIHRYRSCSMLVLNKNGFGYCPGFPEIIE